MRSSSAAGVGGVNPPLLFVVVFCLSMILLSNLMLNSTLEEKENLLAPVGLAYPFFHDSLALLELNLSSLVFEPGP